MSKNVVSLKSIHTKGRLNVLINILGKNLQDVFSEFDGKDYLDPEFDGDVK